MRLANEGRAGELRRGRERCDVGPVQVVRELRRTREVNGEVLTDARERHEEISRRTRVGGRRPGVTERDLPLEVAFAKVESGRHGYAPPGQLGGGMSPSRVQLLLGVGDERQTYRAYEGQRIGVHRRGEVFPALGRIETTRRSVDRTDHV